VRFLGEGYFGQDLSIPAAFGHLRDQGASGGGAEDRDLTYILPAIPLRVMSLVPARQRRISATRRRRRSPTSSHGQFAPGRIHHVAAILSGRRLSRAR
jgi:hypothetical protein